MKKILVTLVLLVSAFYQLNSQSWQVTHTSFPDGEHTLSSFLYNLHDNPAAVYTWMLEQSTNMNDVISALGIPKDQELAFLFQLLPDASKPLLRAKFKEIFGKDPDDVIDTSAAYQIYGFVIARTKLPQNPVKHRQVLTILAQLWQALPSKTADQQYAREFMRKSFKELFSKDPREIL